MGIELGWSNTKVGENPQSAKSSHPTIVETLPDISRANQTHVSAAILSATRPKLAWQDDRAQAIRCDPNPRNYNDAMPDEVFRRHSSSCRARWITVMAAPLKIRFSVRLQLWFNPRVCCTAARSHLPSAALTQSEELRMTIAIPA